MTLIRSIAASRRRKTLLILSQTFIPDPASVGQHMADVAFEMARRGYRVRVYTSARGYEDARVKYPPREYIDGVEIRRLPFGSFGKKSLLLRVLGTALFQFQSLLVGLTIPRVDGVFFSTSPPLIGVVATLIGFFRNVPIAYWAMDLNPDQLIALGKIKPTSLAAHFLEGANRLILRRASLVVALDRFMAERLAGPGRSLLKVRRSGSLSRYAGGGLGWGLPRRFRKRPPPHPSPGVPGEGVRGPKAIALLAGRVDLRHKMLVMPPWPHESHIDADSHVGAETNPFRIRHGLDGKFVVMYSGNHSAANPLTTLLDAAVALKDDPRVRFLMVGGGAGKQEVEAAIRDHDLANLKSLPYQPLSELKYSLSAADLHVVTLGPEMVGIVHPCKIYGAMTVGRPILYFGPRPSHITDLLNSHRFGVCIDHGDVPGAVAAIQKFAQASSDDLNQMGSEALKVLRESFSQNILQSRFCDHVEDALFPVAAVDVS
ncbi:MAG TPA: glycosyltransferase family 4 protein [Tepidisphaeraceae bacterium]|nr:glycosyltransferase family 4 protein [Tepidisphaeraceae bacterium]